MFVWDNDQQVSAYYRSGFNLNDKDLVLISGLSTSISNISGSKIVGFTSVTVALASTMTSYSATREEKQKIYLLQLNQQFLLVVLY